jgi:hypothetical protein
MWDRFKTGATIKTKEQTMSEDERFDWELKSIRDAISTDWARLASKDLTPDERKSITEHLSLNIAALHDLVGRNRTASHRLKLERFNRLRQSRKNQI